MCFNSLDPLCSVRLFESPTIYNSQLMLTGRVYVCVCSGESAAAGGEGGVTVLVSVCPSIYSQQGEELEQLVLHLAQLCHWL